MSCLGGPPRPRIGAGRPGRSIRCIRPRLAGWVQSCGFSPQPGKGRRGDLDTRLKVNRVVAPGPGIVDKPVWSPDGTRLLYSRALGAGPRLYVRGLGEQDREEALPAAADLQLPSDWSRDGRFALFHSENVTDGDVGVLDLQTRKITWILDSPDSSDTG